MEVNSFNKLSSKVRREGIQSQYSGKILSITRDSSILSSMSGFLKSQIIAQVMSTLTMMEVAA